MPSFDPTRARPRQAGSLEVNDAEDGLVVYDPVDQIVHHLNPTASMIFGLCDGTNDVAQIAHRVATAYRLDAPPTDDAVTALGELEARGLITWRRSR